MEKKKGVIERVDLQGVNTYDDESFEPSLINFFYGKNGTGKSTLAKCFEDEYPDHFLEYRDNVELKNYEVLTYNREYIKNNIQSLGNIPGVFMLSETSGNVQNEILDKKVQLNIADKDMQVKYKTLKDAEYKVEILPSDYQERVWKKTRGIVKEYAKCFSGLGTKNRFFYDIKNREPKEMREEELSNRYKIIFGDEPDYPYPSLTPVHELQLTSDEITLLSEPLVNQDNSVFSAFIKRISASNWVREGHEKFHKISEGKCPYCQQKLPSSFESDYADCFSEIYNNQINKIRNIRDKYSEYANKVDSCIATNITFMNSYTSSVYSDITYIKFQKMERESDKLRNAIMKNISLLEEKIKDPASIIGLDDVSEMVKIVNTCIIECNASIDETNEIILNKKEAQVQLIEDMRSYVRFVIDKDLVELNVKYQQAETEKTKAKEEYENAHKLFVCISDELKKLNSQTINTNKAKDDINMLIRSAGFQGFHIEEKPGTKYIYQLVRSNGSIADELSEGERNFIGFLYFYTVVMGTQSDEGDRKNKIVVIDDPVTSMDSSAMFTVATLIRNMVDICRNTLRYEERGLDDFIHQVFCLTHNPFFYREISHNYLSYYDSVNYYLISKDSDNESHITLCVKPCIGPDNGENKENYTPIKNSYDALWSEFNDSKDPMVKMNCARRIIEYYFIQVCGFTNLDLKNALINDKKLEAMGMNAVVSAMLSCLEGGHANFIDGLYFDSMAIDAKQIETSFEAVFTVMGQAQHYKMMTNNRKKQA